MENAEVARREFQLAFEHLIATFKNMTAAIERSHGKRKTAPQIRVIRTRHAVYVVEA